MTHVLPYVIGFLPHIPAAFTLDNLDGDWFVPGNLLGGNVSDAFWKQVKAGSSYF